MPLIGFTADCIRCSGTNFANSGIQNSKVLLATDAINHPESLGQKIVVLGGGSIGCEIALGLAEKEKMLPLLRYRIHLQEMQTPCIERLYDRNFYSIRI